MTLSPAWWSWEAVLSFSHISIKFQPDSNILASSEAVQDNTLPMYLWLGCFPASQKDKYRNKIKINYLNKFFS